MSIFYNIFINKSLSRTQVIRRNSLQDNYSLSESYRLQGDFETAESILLDIPLNFRLQRHDYENYNEYLRLFYFLKSVHDDSRKIAQLNSVEIAELETYLLSSSSKVSTIADNILCFFYDICKPINLDISSTNPNPSAKLSSPFNAEVLLQMNNKVSIHPNPAQSFTTINWEIPSLENTAQIFIQDLTGKIITSHTITGIQGQWVWDTREAKNGMFIYEIVKDGLQIHTGKIVVNN